MMMVIAVMSEGNHFAIYANEQRQECQRKRPQPPAIVTLAVCESLREAAHTAAFQDVLDRPDKVCGRVAEDEIDVGNLR